MFSFSQRTNLWNYVPWLIKLILMFLPLPGYIHPDEFFQSPEIVAGDVFNLKHHRTWEFQAASPPVRSIVPPYLICGPPYLLLRLLANVYPGIVTSYTLLIFPRLWILLLAIVIYNAILKHQRLCFQALATSFLFYTFLDRTFSNTNEAALFVIFLEITKSTSKHGEWKWPIMFKISLALTLGIFNRPTFIAFACVPTLRWLLDGFKTRNLHDSVYKLTVKVFFLGCISSAISLAFISVDSIYYHGNIFKHFTPKKIVIAPLNFAMYNTNSDNLIQHTLHNRLTHLFVNLPQLLGPCAFYYYRDVWAFLRSLHEGQFQRISYMFLVITVPLLALSIFPHQEVRFLVPLIFPAVFTYGKKIYTERLVWKIWVIFNVVCGFMYAFLHQGGVVSSISFLNQNPLKQAHLVYYHTYMPPEHLFVVNQKCGTVGFNDPACSGPKLQIYDLKGATLASLASKIKDLKNPRTNSVFVVAPVTVPLELPPELVLKQSVLFFPHISMEDLPTGAEMMKCTNGLVVHTECVMDLLSLCLYEVDLK